MEHTYKHYTGAIVKVDNQGKKRIFKDGIEFRTFTELKNYEWDKFHKKHNSYTQDYVSIKNK